MRTLKGHLSEAGLQIGMQLAGGQKETVPVVRTGFL